MSATTTRNSLEIEKTPNHTERLLMRLREQKQEFDSRLAALEHGFARRLADEQQKRESLERKVEQLWAAGAFRGGGR